MNINENETNAQIVCNTTSRDTERMSRKQFNSFLYKLYGCKGKNDVTADDVYEGEDFFIEIFRNSPDGLMIAIHHGFYGFNFQSVDVMRPDKDRIADPTSSEDAGVDFPKPDDSPTAEPDFEAHKTAYTDTVQGAA